MDGQLSQAQLTFAGHVHELRRRLVWPAMILLAGGFIGYRYNKEIIGFLQAPLNQTLYYSSPAGGFNFVMKVCVILGVILAIPVLTYNLVAFLKPAFAKQISRRLIILITAFSIVFGMAGAAFAYFLILPVSLHFFMGVNTTGLTPLIAADDYLNFVLTCVLTFFLLFQIPLIVLFINHIKPLSPRKLLKYEKYVIAGSLVIALVLPFTYDPVTMFLIALPMIVLFNVSLLFVWIANRRRAKRQAAARPQPAPKPRTPALRPAPVPRALLPQVNLVSLEPAVAERPAAGRLQPAFSGGSSLHAPNFLDLRNLRPTK